MNDKIALCLSGGGFRATLFHAGSLKRLNEFGILSHLSAISSVSGGSITNGVLATQWAELGTANSEGIFTRFDELVFDRLVQFCREDLRTDVLVWDRVNPINWPQLLQSDYSVTDRLAIAYDTRLNLDVRLADIPTSPSFVFCATNLMNGVSWEFTNTTMGDYQLGHVPVSDTTVGKAVAASSSYPITFPPLIVSHGDKNVPLTDGGVYDNLGLEPVTSMDESKPPAFSTILVSDAGAPFDIDDRENYNAFARTTRSFGAIWNQVGALRKRWLINAYKRNIIKGTYWGLGSDVRNYELTNSPGFIESALAALTSVRTDLDSFSDGEIASLVNHGYALANAAILKWANQLPLTPAEFRWPFPAYTTEAEVMNALADSSDRGIWIDVWNSITN